MPRELGESVASQSVSLYHTPTREHVVRTDTLDLTLTRPTFRTTLEGFFEIRF